MKYQIETMLLRSYPKHDYAQYFGVGVDYFQFRSSGGSSKGGGNSYVVTTYEDDDGTPARIGISYRSGINQVGYESSIYGCQTHYESGYWFIYFMHEHNEITKEYEYEFLRLCELPSIPYSKNDVYSVSFYTLKQIALNAFISQKEISNEHWLEVTVHFYNENKRFKIQRNYLDGWGSWKELPNRDFLNSEFIKYNHKDQWWKNEKHYTRRQRRRSK